LPSLTPPIRDLRTQTEITCSEQPTTSEQPAKTHLKPLMHSTK
jgi:hypothetical protein